MRYLILLFAITILHSCAQSNTKQKEIELKEKGLVLKQKELDLKEKQINAEKPSQKTDTSNNLTVEQMVLDIRNEYKRINSINLKSKKYNFVCDAEGAITYYTDNGKVVKVVIDWGVVGDGYSISEYYYKDNKLFFTYVTLIGGPAYGPDIKTEYRTYVNNNKTIKYMEDQKVSACTTCEYNNSSIEYKALNAFNTSDIQSALCN